MSHSTFIAPPCEEDVDILYEDGTLLIANKPAGLLSVPGRLPENQDCLIRRVQENFPDALIVHRLDMSTSGLMVLALGPDSHRALSKQFQQRAVEKEYQAVVYGKLDCDNGVVDLPLACDWPNRPRQQVNFNWGKASQTVYQRLGFTPEGNSHLLLKPVTGRSHQLRVHMASLGHPILGCEFYAHPMALAQSSRLLLHASRLSFAHPTSGKVMNTSCRADFAPQY